MKRLAYMWDQVDVGKEDGSESCDEEDTERVVI